ncbi:acid phosphatase det1, partial [Pichia californica]
MDEDMAFLQFNNSGISKNNNNNNNNSNNLGNSVANNTDIEMANTNIAMPIINDSTSTQMEINNNDAFGVNSNMLPNQTQSQSHQKQQQQLFQQLQQQQQQSQP